MEFIGLLRHVEALKSGLEEIGLPTTELIFLAEVVGSVHSSILEKIEAGLSTRQIHYPNTVVEKKSETIEAVLNGCPGLYWLHPSPNRKRKLECQSNKPPVRYPYISEENESERGVDLVCGTCYQYSRRQVKRKKKNNSDE